MTVERDAIVRAFASAVAACDPRRAVREQITVEPTGAISLAGIETEASQPIEAFAIGKAAAGMMLGAVDALGDRLRRGFVLTKDGQSADDLPASILQTEASHPVLDERSLAATALLLDWLADSPADAVVLCLLSGGGSALLELPVDGVSLEDLQRVTRLLLHAGADIHQLNAVRSQLSRVKGGRLRAMIPGQVVNLLVSDVLGNDVSVIASGPTVPPISTSLDALNVIDLLGLSGKLPDSVQAALNQPSGQFWTGRIDDHTAIIADNQRAVSAAGQAFHRDGLLVERSLIPIEGEASTRAVEFVRSLLDVRLPITAVIGGGEYTVEVTGDGLGGRNTEFALAAAIELDRLGVTEWTVASLASDGDDAMTGVAGAIVNGTSARQLREHGVEPEDALANNDSLPPLKSIGAAYGTGPTGTNVNDLYLAVRSPRM